MTWADALVLFNLFVLESLLSIDNAAVLAVMVKDLPRHEQPRALRYGMFGAFFFRAMCLVLAAWLIKILWLKILGGLYLLYLAYGHFTPKRDTIEEGVDKAHNKWYLKLKNKLGAFWSTVILVEIMDLAFSIDNVFAAVAMTSNLWLIVIGVCIGIVAMRYVATWFTVLMHKFPTLEGSAFVVIALLGIKLVLSGSADYVPALQPVGAFMQNHWFDLAFSGTMMLVFATPLLLRKPAKAVA